MSASSTGMTPAQGPVDPIGMDRQEIENFLYVEAELLDEWRLDEWLELFTEDARYVVPCNDCPDGDPTRDLVLIDDDMVRLRSRVDRLNSRKAHREYPHASTSHQVTNVKIVEFNADDVAVRAAFTVWRFRNGSDDHYVGRYDYKLRRSEGRLKIARKRVVMQMSSLRPAATVSILL